ncbi:MAG: ribulose-phosphate 3-epimerase [bacterium]
MVKIAASILAADFSELYQAVRRIEKAADSLHFDVMDGHFVPNITFGPDIVRSLRNKVDLPFDVHLMVDNPQEWIVPFARAGCDLITVHVETSPHIDRLITLIRKEGVRAGVALNPSTPLGQLEHILSRLDLVLPMTVNPGFGGQEFLGWVLPKVRTLREISKERRICLEIEVDGGINQATAKEAAASGATVLVVGTSVFNANDPEAAILELKSSCGSLLSKRRE